MLGSSTKKKRSGTRSWMLPEAPCEESLCHLMGHADRGFGACVAGRSLHSGRVLGVGWFKTLRFNHEA